jgi:hypothetical protein
MLHVPLNFLLNFTIFFVKIINYGTPPYAKQLKTFPPNWKQSAEEKYAIYVRLKKYRRPGFATGPLHVVFADNVATGQAFIRIIIFHPVITPPCLHTHLSSQG